MKKHGHEHDGDDTDAQEIVKKNIWNQDTFNDKGEYMEGERESKGTGKCNEGHS